MGDTNTDLEIVPGKTLSSELTATKWSKLVELASGASRASGAGRASLRPSIDLGRMGSLFVEEIYIPIQKPKLGQKVPFGFACPTGAYIIGFAGDVGSSVVSIDGNFFKYTSGGTEYDLLPAASKNRTGQFFSTWIPESRTEGELVLPPARLTRAVSSSFLPSQESCYLKVVSTDGKQIATSIWIAY